MVKGKENYGLSSESQPLVGFYDRPLPFCGCGIGWFSFIFGFIMPLSWYYGTILYLTSYYHTEPRERAGLAACAVAALVCTIAILCAVMGLLV
eukprot:c23386_g2_i1 orf=526-804(+)